MDEYHFPLYDLKWENTEMKSRKAYCQWADNMRAILILLLVLGHSNNGLVHYVNYPHWRKHGKAPRIPIDPAILWAENMTGWGLPRY